MARDEQLYNLSRPEHGELAENPDVNVAKVEGLRQVQGRARERTAGKKG